MSANKETFEGWAGLDAMACEGNMEFRSFQVKPFEEDDVEIKVMYCGVCGSDVSALSGEWGPVDGKVQVCGHEIVGEVIRAGSKVENGIRMGSIIITFGAPYHRADSKQRGAISNGGFAKHWRGPSRFTIPVPEGVDPAAAAPLCCGCWYECQNVGVIGIGGLGHFAVLFASSMGAKVTAISRGVHKAEDTRALGASEVIATGDNISEGINGHERSLNLIICTINPEELPITKYLPLLRPHGTFVIVGVVPKPLSIPIFALLCVNGRVAGSNIGSPAMIKRMLEFVKEKNIKPWIKKHSMDEINKALPDLREGQPQYRFVLVNTDNGGTM